MLRKKEKDLFFVFLHGQKSKDERPKDKESIQPQIMYRDYDRIHDHKKRRNNIQTT